MGARSRSRRPILCGEPELSRLDRPPTAVWPQRNDANLRAQTGAVPSPSVDRPASTGTRREPPGDTHEQQADRIAKAMLTGTSHRSAGHAPVPIQPLPSALGGAADAVPTSVEQVRAASGRPLEPAARQDMERRFGRDFSQVRVHTDAAAARSAREVNAHAYTAGRNVVFADGRYAPRAHDGRRLLAHELVHVVQQSAAGAPMADPFFAMDQHRGAAWPSPGVVGFWPRHKANDRCVQGLIQHTPGPGPAGVNLGLRDRAEASARDDPRARAARDRGPTHRAGAGCPAEAQPAREGQWGWPRSPGAAARRRPRRSV